MQVTLLYNNRAHLGNETENTYNVLQIGYMLTTVHGSFSISNYDKSAEFLAKLKFKFLV
jgi:hypothetical protein